MIALRNTSAQQVDRLTFTEEPPSVEQILQDCRTEIARTRKEKAATEESIARLISTALSRISEQHTHTKLADSEVSSIALFLSENIPTIQQLVRRMNLSNDGELLFLVNVLQAFAQIEMNTHEVFNIVHTQMQHRLETISASLIHGDPEASSYAFIQGLVGFYWSREKAGLEPLDLRIQKPIFRGFNKALKNILHNPEQLYEVANGLNIEETRIFGLLGNSLVNYINNELIAIDKFPAPQSTKMHLIFGILSLIEEHNQLDMVLREIYNQLIPELNHHIGYGEDQKARGLEHVSITNIITDNSGGGSIWREILVNYKKYKGEA